MGPVLEALGISLPLALGIAAAPWAIITLMILLLTPRAVSNAYAFLMGWFIGLMLVGIVIMNSPGLMNDSGEPSRLMGWIRLGMGTVFMVVVGAASIARQGLTSWQELVVFLLFCVIASTGVMIPHIIFLLFRKNTELIFGKIKVWILKNRVLVLLLILIIFGGLSLYKGIMIIQTP